MCHVEEGWLLPGRLCPRPPQCMVNPVIFRHIPNSSLGCQYLVVFVQMRGHIAQGGHGTELCPDRDGDDAKELCRGLEARPRHILLGDIEALAGDPSVPVSFVQPPMGDSLG